MKAGRILLLASVFVAVALAIAGWFLWNDLRLLRELGRAPDPAESQPGVVEDVYRLPAATSSEPALPVSAVSVPAQRPAISNAIDSSKKTGGSAARPAARSVDAVKGEHVLSFASSGDMERFVQIARDAGVTGLKTIRIGNTVLIRTRGQEELDQLLKNAPKPVDDSPNYYVRIPEVAAKPVDVDSSYKPFGSEALKWLGVQSPDASWGKGIMIAVLDTGIAPNSKLPEENILRVAVDGNGPMQAGDYSGHGTAVASLITGELDSFPGIAPAALILNLNVLSSDGVGDTFSLSKGIVDAVDRGAKIINLSLGGQGDSPLLQQAVKYALGKGVAIVAAVGNDGVNGVSYPAAYEGVMAVSAVDANGRHLPFANSGPQTAVSAPGYGVTAAWTNEILVGFSGTSASVPFVSGAIAAVLSLHPRMSAREAQDFLCKYSNDIGEPGRDNETGAGVLDLKRVLSADTKGIYDIAVGMPYIRPPQTPTSDVRISAYVQNRGTEAVPGVTMSVQINSAYYSVSFGRLEVGQTASREFVVGANELRSLGYIEITCSAVIDGIADSNPLNNMIKSRLSRQQ